MNIRHLALLTLFSISLCVHSQESNAPAFGKGLFNLKGKDSTWAMKIGLRMQVLAIAQWEEGPDGGLVNPESNFLIRRSRLKFDGFALTPRLKYKIEIGLSNRDISGASQYTGNTPRQLLDAVVMWNFYENFELWAGETKLPGNIERVISSANLQLVDRSLVNSFFNIDRDQGIQLRHHIFLSDNFLVREKIAISQGEGRNITSRNLGGHQFTARLELLPFGEFHNKGDYLGSDQYREPSPKLMLSATYDSNQDAVRTRSNLGSFMLNDIGLYETDINTFFIDAMFKYRGFSFMGEYADRNAKDPIAKNSDGSQTGMVVQEGNGINLQAGYLFKSNWEVAGRYTNVSVREQIIGKTPETQYTLGLSRYIVGHKLKVQTDLSYLSIRNDADELMYRLQFELHF